MEDNSLRIAFDYKYPDDAALVVYSAFGGGYFGGEPTIGVRKIITGEKAVKLYSELSGKSVEDIRKGYLDEKIMAKLPSVNKVENKEET